MSLPPCPETGTPCERMCLTMCHIISEDRVALRAAVEAYEADAVAYRATIERLRGPREPPHCPTCDCPGPSPGASHGS